MEQWIHIELEVVLLHTNGIHIGLNGVGDTNFLAGMLFNDFLLF